MTEVKISDFLTERKDRFKPDVANNLGLNRIEKIDFSGNIHISDNKPTKTNMILIKKGDLVISGINVQKGAMSVYKGEEDLLATIHYSSYIYDKEKIDLEYLNWFLKSQTFIEILEEQTGSGIKTELKAKKFLTLKIHLPNLNKQKEIIKKLDNHKNSHDILLNELIVQKETISKLKSQILQDAIMGKLTTQNPNDKAIDLLNSIKKEKEKLIEEKKIKKEKTLSLVNKSKEHFEIPENWEWVRLPEIVYFINGDRSSNYPSGTDIKENGIYFINSKNIYNNKINLESEHTQYITEEKYKSLNSGHLKNNDLVMVLRGATRGKIGLFKGEEGFINAQLLIIRRISSSIDLDYLLSYFTSSLFKEEINKIEAGSAQPHFSATNLSNISIPIPPLKEQKEIVEKVDSLFEKLEIVEKECEKNIEYSNQLLQSVLKEVFEN